MSTGGTVCCHPRAHATPNLSIYRDHRSLMKGTHNIAFKYVQDYLNLCDWSFFDSRHLHQVVNTEIYIHFPYIIVQGECSPNAMFINNKTLECLALISFTQETPSLI